ncbi:MAG: hypothetical protein ACK4GG_06620 [Sphingomonas sp.]
MTDRNEIETPKAELRSWVEPEISVLAIEETAGFPGRGADGGRFVDCTLS